MLNVQTKKSFKSYLQFWFVLCAVLAMGCDAQKHEIKPEVVSPVAAQTKTVGSAKQPAELMANKEIDIPEEKVNFPFLWEISYEGKKSYMIGLLSAGLNPYEILPDDVWTYVEESKSIVFMSDIEKIERDKKALKKLVFLPEGQTLNKVLGPEYWQKFEALAGKQKSVRYKYTKPFMAGVELMVQMLPEPKYTKTMSSAFRSFARVEHKPKYFLEEPEFEMALLSQVEIKDLKEMIDQFEERKTVFQQVIKAYKNGDEALAKKLHVQTIKKYPQIHQKLMVQRPEKWMPELEKHFKAGDAFVVVGAAYLYGEISLIDKLKARGYQAKRVFD